MLTPGEKAELPDMRTKANEQVTELNAEYAYAIAKFGSKHRRTKIAKEKLDHMKNVVKALGAVQFYG
jgi:hypothetical protein